jgi:hypothetical protein
LALRSRLFDIRIKESRASKVDGLSVIASHPVGAQRPPETGSAKQSRAAYDALGCFVASLLAMTAESYRTFSARLNKNTPCSPNMFQNHHGRFVRTGRP